MSRSMGDVLATLDGLEAPDLWEDIEARSALSIPSSETTSDPFDLDAGLGDDSAPGLRRRVLVAAAGALVAVVVAVVALVNAGGDEQGGVDTADTPSTTTTAAPDTELDPAPTVVPTLEWAPAAASPPESTTQQFFGFIPWSPAGFSAYDAGGDELYLSADGEAWVEPDFLPDGFRVEGVSGTADTWAVASWEDGNFDSASPISVALSRDQGASWDLLAPLTPQPFDAAFVTGFVQGASVLVANDVVLVQVVLDVRVDAEAAMRAAGRPVDDLTIVNATWSDQIGVPRSDGIDYVVTACDSALELPVCVENAEQYFLGDLGLDPAQLQQLSRGSIRPFYRSVDGSPFERVDSPVLVPAMLRSVNDEFVVTSQPTDTGSSEIHRSADGIDWESSPFTADLDPLGGIGPWFLHTDDALFATRDGALIRSRDNGRSWATLDLPEADNIRLAAAGPAGIVVVGRLPDDVAPDEDPVIERDGFTITGGIPSRVVVTDAEGTVVMDSQASLESDRYLIDRPAEGPIYFRLTDRETGEVALEITTQEFVDLTVGGGDGEPERQVIAWSPDGTGLEWTEVGAAFGAADGSVAKVETIGVGEDSILAVLTVGPPARQVDFRTLTENFTAVDPIPGEATVWYRDQGERQTFVAEVD